MHILMVAAENGALPGGKIGGIGDVIRDVPRALVAAGHQVTVITPGYQSLSKLPGAKQINTLTVDFCSSLETVTLFQVEEQEKNGGTKRTPGVEHWLIEHPLFAACGEGSIYCDDDNGPFATDAHKFALFCHAVCYSVVTEIIPRPDIFHLHDWHAALVLFLRKTLSVYKPLLKIPTVYTVHNLSIQGVRPFQVEESSLEKWFPLETYSKAEIQDPVTESCVNMMRMGINLADKIHVVSPTYAQEILNASDVSKGFIGGEGLERDLLHVAAQNNLIGILNGCVYPDSSKNNSQQKTITKTNFITLANACLLDWVGDETYISTAFFFAQQRLMAWSKRRKADTPIIASIGRLTAQKVSLLEAEIEPGVSTLEALLKALNGGLYIMIGTGDRDYENFMSRIMSRYENFIFLKGYSDVLSDALYRYCDIFLMPSSYEPCGISQMLAMRAGKPCLVHKVGGLADTVQHNENGFCFSGDTVAEQKNQLLKVFKQVIQMKENEPERWQNISLAAGNSRFSWSKSIKEYETKLYSVVR